MLRPPERAREPESPRLGADTRGAVYVEFLIAFLPFLIFFLCLWQVSILYYAKLVMDHAAFAAARAAAVVVAECPKTVGDSGANTVNTLTENRQKYVSNAAYVALTPLILDGTIGLSLTGPNFVEFPATLGGADQAADGKTPAYAPMTNSLSNIRVRVNAAFICRIAFANAIMCNGFLAKLTGGLFPMSVPISSEAVYPFQGASYAYTSDCK
jgi:Flp pilus assembly protein TadG